MPPRLDSLFDFTHRVALNTLFIVGGLIAYNSGRVYIDRRARLEEWKENNKHWENDPFFVFDPNHMRLSKKDEEEILLTRPMWYAAKELRELHGIPLQPPYLPISNPLMGRNGETVTAGQHGFEGDIAAAANARR